MRRVVALVVLLAACGQPPAPAVVDAPMVAAPQRFSAGEVLVYRFDWRVDATATDTAVMPTSVALGAAIGLAGELTVRVVEADTDSAMLAVALRRLDRHEIRLMDANVLADAAPLLDREVFVDVGADGDLRRILFDRDSSSVLRHVMGGLLAHIDLRVAPARTDAWQAVVPAGNGLAEVDYRNDADALHRALHRYARLDAFAPGLVEPAVEGESTIRHDDRALPLRIDSTELLVIASGSDDPLFDSRTRFSLERVRIEQGEAGGLPAPELLVERDPLAPPDTDEAERELAKRYAGALDVDGVELVVDGVANGLLPHRGFMVEATGLLRGWPQQADALAPMFAGTDDRHARSLVVDMLASAGTPEAQRVLIDLLGDASLRSDPSYPAWLQRLAFLRAPLPEVAGVLLEAHDDARARELPRVRASSLYPLGSIAAALVDDDPLLAELAHQRLLDELDGAGDDDELRVAALAGLGNEARGDALELVLAHVDASDAAVRIQAASSLRGFDDERAAATLFEQLADPDAGVGTTALAALARHRNGAADSQRLAEAARSAQHHPELAGPLIGALARRLADGPAVRDALVALRERADDAHVRARIDRVLEPPASG
ncbi:MAG TPA: HEAT repeat domain-containing protein [Nannocystaceae bacterium]|nr:HEAT repeat domain-containing protein [Nannocystaceae bacterium]